MPVDLTRPIGNRNLVSANVTDLNELYLKMSYRYITNLYQFCLSHSS